MSATSFICEREEIKKGDRRERIERVEASGEIQKSDRRERLECVIASV